MGRYTFGRNRGGGDMQTNKCRLHYEIMRIFKFTLGDTVLLPPTSYARIVETSTTLYRLLSGARIFKSCSER